MNYKEKISKIDFTNTEKLRNLASSIHENHKFHVSDGTDGGKDNLDRVVNNYMLVHSNGKIGRALITRGITKTFFAGHDVYVACNLCVIADNCSEAECLQKCLSWHYCPLVSDSKE